MIRTHPISTLFPYTTLFRSLCGESEFQKPLRGILELRDSAVTPGKVRSRCSLRWQSQRGHCRELQSRSEEHTSELQSRRDLVCRLLLEKKIRIKSLLKNFIT